MKKIWFFSLLWFLFLTGCSTTFLQEAKIEQEENTEEYSADSTEIIGYETAEDCLFECFLAINCHTEERSNYKKEISKYTSPKLGISFLYASRLFDQDSGEIWVENKIIHENNLLCLESSFGEKNQENEGCIEFLPYQEREQLEGIFNREDKSIWERENTEEISNVWIKGQIPGSDQYFVQYDCMGCAPWPDFSWVDTIEML